MGHYRTNLDLTEGTAKIHEEPLAHMRKYSGSWAVYQNQALDSTLVGHLQFLKYGEDCTYKTPPQQYPMDNNYGLGWRYRLVGIVDLDTGVIQKETKHATRR